MTVKSYSYLTKNLFRTTRSARRPNLLVPTVSLNLQLPGTFCCSALPVGKHTFLFNLLLFHVTSYLLVVAQL